MTPDPSHELLREILAEMREVRRHIERQSELLDVVAFFSRACAGNENRARYNQRLESRRESDIHERRRVRSWQRPLTAWLNERGLVFDHFAYSGLHRGHTDEMAVTIGAYYDALEPFLKELVHALNRKDGFRFSVDDLDSGAARVVRGFAQQMEDYGFLRAMNYVEPDNVLFVDPLFDPDLVKFLTGGWLETLVEHRVAQLSPDWIPTRCLRNALARNSDDEVFEFDLLLPASPAPIYIDCKAGNLESQLSKIARNVKALQLPFERNLVVVPSLAERDSEALSERCGARIVALSHLESLIPQNEETVGEMHFATLLQPDRNEG